MSAHETHLLIERLDTLDTVYDYMSTTNYYCGPDAQKDESYEHLLIERLHTLDTVYDYIRNTMRNVPPEEAYEALKDVESWIFGQRRMTEDQLRTTAYDKGQ